MRHIHKYPVPIIVKVHGTDEHWYYAPMYNPKHVPVTEFDNLLAVPYEHIMPVVKQLSLALNGIWEEDQ